MLITLICPQRNKIKYIKYQTVRKVSRSTRNKVKTDNINQIITHVHDAHLFNWLGTSTSIKKSRGVKIIKYVGYLDNYHLAEYKSTLRSDVLVYGV